MNCLQVGVRLEELAARIPEKQQFTVLKNVMTSLLRSRKGFGGSAGL